MEILYNSLEKQDDNIKPDFELKVTDLKPALQNQNRVNVFISDHFEFSLDLTQIVEYKIKVGQILSQAEIKKYREASEFGKLYQRALEWALLRPRSKKEAKDYLLRSRKRREDENRKRRKNKERPKAEKIQYHLKTKELPSLSDVTLVQVLQKLVEKGYIDDRKFTEYYIEHRFQKKGISKRRLKQELQKKGINSQLVEELLLVNNRRDEDEICKMIMKKRGKYTDEKLIAYLVRQGFDYQLVKSAVQDFSETD